MPYTNHTNRLWLLDSLLKRKVCNDFHFCYIMCLQNVYKKWLFESQRTNFVCHYVQTHVFGEVFPWNKNIIKY